MPSERIQNIPRRRKGLILDNDKGNQRLKNWLEEPVCWKESNGEESYRKMIGYLKTDLAANGLYQANTSAALKKEIDTYLVAFYQYHCHNSTSDPLPGRGKAQTRERNKPLFYYRSQTDHPYKKGDTDKHYINNEHEALLNITEQEKKPNKVKVPYMSIYNGATKSNVNYLSNNVVSVDYFNGLKPKAAQHKLLTQEQIRKKLYQAPTADTITETYSLKSSLNDRHELGKLCFDGASELGLENLHAVIPEGNSNLFIWIDCYQLFNKEFVITHTLNGKFQREALKKDPYYKNYKKIVSKAGQEDLFEKISLEEKELKAGCGDNYTQGWVNVILTFFTALLNYNCKKKSLSIYTNRRQSFGFNRPTITDVGECIRLSLANMPIAFASVLKQSLEDLDRIISNLDPNIHIAAQLPIEAQRGKKTSLRTGNFYLLSLRSDQEKVNFLEAARLCIEQDAAKTVESPDLGLNEFIKKYVIAYTFQKYSKGKLREPRIKNIKAVLEALAILQETPKIKIPKKDRFDITISKIEALIVPDGQAMPHPNYLKKLSHIIGLCKTKMTKWYQDTTNQTVLKNSHNYAYQKIHNSIVKSEYLLTHSFVYFGNNQGRAHIYSKAINLTEELLENIVILKAARGIRKIIATDDLEKSKVKADEKLLHYFNTQINISAKHIEYYRTQNGQAAAALSVFVASAIAQENRISETANIQSVMNHTIFTGIYLNKVYYETESFLTTLRALYSNELSYQSLSKKINTNTSMIITNLYSAYATCPYDMQGNLITEQPLTDMYDKLPDNKTFIVDITNTHLLDEKIKALIQRWAIHKTKWIILYSSLLKHEQLGLDKYQSGRIIILKPLTYTRGENLRSNTNANVALTKIKAHSDHCRDSLTESYLKFSQKLLYPDIV